MKIITKKNISAVILAGGRSSRINSENKGLMLLNNKPLINYTFDIIKPNVSTILISSNNHFNTYSQYGLVVADDLVNFQGPLAGISKALSIVTTPYLIVVACDNPFINQVFINRLVHSMSNYQADICVAHDGKKIHPTLALIKTHLKDNLLEFLNKGDRKLSLWFENNHMQKIDFSDHPNIFTNLNTLQDFKSLNRA